MYFLKELTMKKIAWFVLLVMGVAPAVVVHFLRDIKMMGKKKGSSIKQINRKGA